MPLTPVMQTLRALTPSISVGILTASMMKLGDELTALENTGVGILHFDVMDGCFCPSMTIGPPFIKGIKTNLLKDIHLMINEPLNKLADFVAAGADILTVHWESEPTHIHRVFQALGKMANANDPDRGIVRGLAINPGTPMQAIEPLLDEIEMVTLLGINPGWGGQKFIAATSERMVQLRTLIADRDILICLDGGITKENIVEIAKLGADVVVTGSAVYDGKTPHDNAISMLNIIRSAK